jgi:hypothetical protein
MALSLVINRLSRIFMSVVAIAEKHTMKEEE